MEIQPDCVERIAENARRNGLTSIEPKQLAASNQSGSARFFFRREPDILTSVASLIPSDYATCSAEVATARLDEFLAGRGAQDRISLIKIDVEGAELQTLDGLRETLAVATPDVLVEVNEFGELSDVRRRFPHGYRCYQIAEERRQVRRLRPWSRSIGRNYLFTTDPEVSW